MVRFGMVHCFVMVHCFANAPYGNAFLVVILFGAGWLGLLGAVAVAIPELAVAIALNCGVLLGQG